MLWNRDLSAFNGVLILIMRTATADIIPTVIKNYSLYLTEFQSPSPLDNIITRTMRIVKCFYKLFFRNLHIFLPSERAVFLCRETPKGGELSRAKQTN